MAAPRIRAVLAVMIVAALPACGGAADEPKAEAVRVQVIAPPDGSSVGSERVTIRGTVSPADANVQILGNAVQVGNGVFTGSVPLHVGSNTIDIVASAPNATPTSVTINIRRVASASAAPKPRAQNSAPPLAAARDCGGGVIAGARTSCPFAENVRAAFEASGSGILDVHSPTTGQSYRVYCTSGPAHVCTGGNGASVSFTTTSVSLRYDVTPCGSGLAAGPNTSCAFAENVRAAYLTNGPGWISVYSPVTRRTYDMYCTPTSPHVCTGGNNAAVYFP
jgi:hypothetical protein